MPSSRTALTAELAREEAACVAARENIATARRRIGTHRAAIKALLLVIDGQQEVLLECRAAIKRIKRELKTSR